MEVEVVGVLVCGCGCGVGVGKGVGSIGGISVRGLARCFEVGQVGLEFCRVWQQHQKRQSAVEGLVGSMTSAVFTIGALSTQVPRQASHLGNASLSPVARSAAAWKDADCNTSVKTLKKTPSAHR